MWKGGVANRASSFGAVALAAAVSCSHAPPVALPSGLREHLKLDRFDIVTSVRGLPLGVRDALQSLFGSHEFDVQRDIADPGVRFQGTDAVGGSGLPLRRLIAAECSVDHCLVSYVRGGSAMTWHVALFHWTPEATRFEWGGLAPGPLATIEDARTVLLSGAFNGSPTSW